MCRIYVRNKNLAHKSFYKTRIVTYYVGHSFHRLWGLVWSNLINLHYISLRYLFL